MRWLISWTGGGFWLAAALLSGGCGGSDSPTTPTPTPNPALAGFRISGAEGDQMISYTEGPNRVFCSRAAGWADLWVRMAEQRAADGENGPHIDLDLCNDSGGGAFSPMDPRAARCGAGKSWDIWWHDGSGGVYANTPQASDCALALSVNGNQLEGTFHCRGLIEDGGARTVDVLDGFFRCTVG